MTGTPIGPHTSRNPQSHAPHAGPAPGSPPAPASPHTSPDPPEAPGHGPLGALDVERAIRLAITALGAAREEDWSVPAGSLRWDCWETVEHLADDLFSYAARLAPQRPPVSAPLPFAWAERRPEGPVNVVFLDRGAGAAGLFQGLEACAGMLAATLRSRPATTRAYHVYGLSDPEGFAAMGVVETLVHTHDVAEGLNVEWAPPADLCARVLARLFPHVPAGVAEPWPTLLWATGRIALDGRPRLTEWRWYSAPHGDGAPDPQTGTDA